MKKSDILELKKRFKKNECTFTKMSGCYVDSEKEKILTFTETFLNLEEEEFYKYLEIAKKVLSGTLGNNLLELSFPTQETNEISHQQFLLGLRSDRLENEQMMDLLYTKIIEEYHYAGNYLIIAFHDAYDVMTKTSDKNKLDESEEVYEYIICAVCPVELSKAGLGYLSEENRIGARVRDWVVGAPECGFLYPAFTDRSSDIHSILYYTKNPKEPHAEFMENILGCSAVKTSFEKKEDFTQLIKRALPDDEEKNNSMILDIQSELHDLVILHEEEAIDDEPLLLTGEVLKEAMETAQIPDEIVQSVEKSFTEEFSEEILTADDILDNKTIHQCEQYKTEKDLKMQVSNLTRQLNNRQEEGKIFLTVSKEKADLITSEFINGKKCIIIPLEEDDTATVNGEMFLQ